MSLWSSLARAVEKAFFNMSQDHRGPRRDRWLDTEKNTQGGKQRHRDKADGDKTEGESVAVWPLGSSVQVSWAVGPDSFDLIYLGEQRTQQ